MRKILSAKIGSNKYSLGNPDTLVFFSVDLVDDGDIADMA